MKELLNEVIEAVSNINEQLYEQRGPEANVLAIVIEPFVEIIIVEWGEYGISRLWCSDGDDREWIEAESIPYPPPTRGFKVVPAHYEPLEPFLRKKIMELINQISAIKL